ncbi:MULTISPECIES: NADPH-dependent FMN reductase [Paenibacillus]|uniref:NADPH-dependent FMN reductase n=1 Tax=Paenibacillus radicis (ex Xue et al. 2023) TaxID=2972489 RepID=A0ABT1YFQ6_9BACL|nr:NADPH-dependent FMN reductase [Paenibacillus radicis (ex Xue et al. 2023)]MCR8631767.1 NADPH-dependent FMN reductase [Paenibacillus radicis (ex Xue et al. 2023)]
MARIVIISGSPSASSRLQGVLDFVQQAGVQAGLDVEWVQVRDLAPEDLVYSRFDSPAIIEANRVIAEADAVVVASPIYKASYTGVLKSFLDLIPQKGLEGKVVLPLAIGGTIAHLLAIDHAFKPVLSALGAHHILSGAFILDTQVQRLENGSFQLNEEIAQRLSQVVETFIQEASWRAERNQTTGLSQDVALT